MTIASRVLFHFKNSLTITTPPFTLTKPNQQKDWRSQIKQTQLITQISTILLQTQLTYWPSLLKNPLNKLSLTPFSFLQLLKITKINPLVSLHFFNYAKDNLGFQPDAKVLITLSSQLVGSGRPGSDQPGPGKPILDLLIQTYPLDQIVGLLKVDSGFHVLRSILECYCKKGLFLQAVHVYRIVREKGYFCPIESCNLLLDLLCKKNELKLAWCYYGSIIRNGIQENVFTWCLIAQLLSKNGNFEKIGCILDKGICSPVVYNLLVDCYAKSGNFEAAFGYLNDMCRKNIDPSFSTFSSILDGACKYRNVEVTGLVMSSMVAIGHLPKLMLPDYLSEMCSRNIDPSFSTFISILDGACKHRNVEATDLVMSSMVENGHFSKVVMGEYDCVIQKLSDLGKTYAAELFFRESSEKKIELRDSTYGSLLRALSKEGRVDNAILMYNVIRERKVFVNDKCYSSFMVVLCDENPKEEISILLKELIGRGLVPLISQLSKFIVSLCEKHKWKEAEELLNVTLQRGLQVESFCCSSLVRHYCFSRRIDSAISLHTELERLRVTLDVETYGIVLDRLFKSRRGEEAFRIFDYMRTHDMLSSESFSIVIRGLCQGKEFRKAMRLHDEMLKLGLKPDKKAYTRLISGFG